jgi:hypothetical protein
MARPHFLKIVAGPTGLESISHYSKDLARYELYKRIIDVPGDIVEGGVFHGGGLFAWARMAQIFNPLSKRRVVGFDTFDGFPAAAAQLEYDRQSGAAANEENVELPRPSVERMMQSARAMQVEHRIELVPGDATTTIAEYVRDNPGFRIALLNLDFDMYDPTIAALRHLFPLIVPGGVIAFDDYAIRGWGESDAVDEFFAQRPVRYRSFPWASSPKAYLVKAA